jgi:hypothetical protein
MPRQPTANLLPNSVPPEYSDVAAAASLGSSSKIDAELQRINAELHKMTQLSQQAKERSPICAASPRPQRPSRSEAPGSLSPDRQHLAPGSKLTDGKKLTTRHLESRQLQARGDVPGSLSPGRSGPRGDHAGEESATRDEDGATRERGVEPSPTQVTVSAKAGPGEERGRPTERRGGRGREGARRVAPASVADERERDVFEDEFPMPLSKSTIETALKCTVKGHGRTRYAESVGSTLPGMSVLREKWTKPPPLYLEDAEDCGGDYSPRSLPGEVSREASMQLPALARRPSSSRAPQTLHRQNRDHNLSAHITALEKRLEAQSKETNKLLSWVMAQEVLEAKYVVPPEMGPPIGEHVRANDDALWRKTERERLDAIADSIPARRMTKLQKKRGKTNQLWHQCFATPSFVTARCRTHGTPDSDLETPEFSAASYAVSVHVY